MSTNPPQPQPESGHGSQSDHRLGPQLDPQLRTGSEKRQRFTTLDVFRGMTVFLMIVVNTQGSGATPYAAMMHAEWNGCTLTDLVFPSFLFAVGNAMAFTNPSPGKIGRRTLLLFAIGYLLTWYPFATPWYDTRIMAVLQRIALAYGLAALAARYLSIRSLIIFSASVLLGYWLILYLAGTPGAQYTIEGNAVRRIDLLLLGLRHMYREKGIVFDPEGLLSTLPSIVNVLAGYLAGRLITLKGKTYETVAKLLLTGTVLIAVGLVWNESFPLNKKLWTSSYVLFTAGIDMSALGALFYWIEMRSRKTGVAFFSVFGRNPLFIYIFSTVIGIFLVIRVSGNEIFIDWINRVFFQWVAPGALGVFLFSVCFALVCWTVGWILDRKKIYIRL